MRSGDHQAWLEQPYEDAGREVDGEANVVQFGLCIDIVVEASAIASYSVVGIENREEAVEQAELAADRLKRDFDASSATDAQVIEMICDAFVPCDMDLEDILEQIEEQQDDEQ